MASENKKNKGRNSYTFGDHALKERFRLRTINFYNASKRQELKNDLRDQLAEDTKESTVYAVMRYEHDASHIEKIFDTRKDAEEYCKKFNNDENGYQLNILEMKQTH